jgi:hypothetical protein
LFIILGEMLELAAGKSTKHANLIAWYERIGQREAVQRGLLIPEANPPEVRWRYLLMRRLWLD